MCTLSVVQYSSHIINDAPYTSPYASETSNRKIRVSDFSVHPLTIFFLNQPGNALRTGIELG